MGTNSLVSRLGERVPQLDLIGIATALFVWSPFFSISLFFILFLYVYCLQNKRFLVTGRENGRGEGCGEKDVCVEFIALHISANHNGWMDGLRFCSYLPG